MRIEQMAIEDYQKVASLWQSTEGIGLHLDDVDSAAGIGAYLERNPDLSFVARDNGTVIGAVLCGHDSRRGYLQHLAVAKNHRRRGIGNALVDKVLAKLQSMGIRKCHIFIFADNADGMEFWQRTGWTSRADIKIMSKNIDSA